MRLSYKRNSRLEAELNWFQSRRSNWDAAITQTQSGSQKKAFNTFRFATNFSSFVHMVKDDIRSYRLHTIKQKTHTFIWFFFFVEARFFFFEFSKRNWIQQKNADMCVCAWCWWTFYLWIVYVAKFKTCDENLNAAWTATMKSGKQEKTERKRERTKRKALNKINE